MTLNLKHTIFNHYHNSLSTAFSEQDFWTNPGQNLKIPGQKAETLLLNTKKNTKEKKVLKQLTTTLYIDVKINLFLNINLVIGWASTQKNHDLNETFNITRAFF